MGAAPSPRISPEEYLALDRKAELKSEYHDGEIFPMVAVSLRHSRISSGMSSGLRIRLRGKGCQEAVAPLRVRVSANQYVYPDIIVYCGEPQLTDSFVDTLTNPKVIVEVLSPSTADYDHGGKFALYQQLPTFEEYVLISQDEPKVEIFRKQSPTSWTYDIVAGLDAVAALKTIGVEIPLAEIYDGLSFA